MSTDLMEKPERPMVRDKVAELMSPIYDYILSIKDEDNRRLFSLRAVQVSNLIRREEYKQAKIELDYIRMELSVLKYGKKAKKSCSINEPIGLIDLEFEKAAEITTKFITERQIRED